MIDKIQPIHLARRAAVYLRQSTLRQLVEHPESTRRQYALRERAQQLGWTTAAIDVIDDDLGLSGAETRRRRASAASATTSRGLIGAIFVLELSRSSTDWHRLLDLCSVADVVPIDEQAATRAPTSPHISSKWCHSRPLRARREASKQNTAPTTPWQRCATSASKPGRAEVPLAERPRSSSMVTTSRKP